MILPTSFVPKEDQGYVIGAIIMPDAASLDRTGDVASRVDDVSRRSRLWRHVTRLTGYSLLDGGFKTNAGTFFVDAEGLRRALCLGQTAKEQNARALLMHAPAGRHGIKEGIVVPVPPPAIPGIGTTGGFEFWIQDTARGESARLAEVTRSFSKRRSERPELSGPRATFRASTQQLRVDVDRDKASCSASPMQDVYSAIQAQFGSLTVSQFNQYSRLWWVILQSEPKYR